MHQGVFAHHPDRLAYDEKGEYVFGGRNDFKTHYGALEGKVVAVRATAPKTHSALSPQSRSAGWEARTSASYYCSTTL
jgi:hypothetical protein